MTSKKFEALVRGVLKKLPREFKDKLQNVDVVIEPAGRKPYLGLYQGIPLKDRSMFYSMVVPDKITLYQRNIEMECRTHGLDIKEEVRNVVLHEIAHHFGISDKKLRESGVY